MDVGGLNLLHISTKVCSPHVLRCRANMAPVRQSGPDSDHDFQAKVLATFEVAAAPYSLASHMHEDGPHHPPTSYSRSSESTPYESDSPKVNSLEIMPPKKKFIPREK